MKIERKRYVVMRKNRTEIWGGLAQHYSFRSIDDIGDFAIKTYRTEKQAHTCSSWDRDFEVVPIVETITDEAGYRKQSKGEWIWTENGEEDYEQYWVCSCCHAKLYWESKFCPNCGAKMKGGAE